MLGLRPLFSMLLLAAAAAGAVAATPAPLPTESATPSEAQREILAMLKMAPQHYRPNSGYGGSYGDLSSRAARRRQASAIAQRYGLQLRDGWPMPLLGVDCFAMIVPPGKSIDEVIAAVSKEPAVAWSQRMNSYSIGSGAAGKGSDDPLYALQPTASEWRLHELQQASTGRGVKVAIIDSQVDVNHPDLAGQFVINKDFVGVASGRPEAHGTHIAGIIGAKAGNGIGIAGIAPGAKLMALRACQETDGGQLTLCQSLALAKALEYAIDNKADVINLSLSGPSDPLLSKLLEAAIDRQVTVVAAFDQRLPQGGFPASVHGVIPVADETIKAIPEGVYGAPGRDLPTTQAGGGWGFVNGTSYAVAEVSGLAALADERGVRPLAPHLVRASSGQVAACATLLGSSRCP